MEVAADASASPRNGDVSSTSKSLSSSAQPSRKEWRAVSEQSARISASEELDRPKLGQSEERLIYEVQRGRGPVDIDFRSISIDGDLDDNFLLQRLGELAKQREELQNLEIELRAQARIVRMQNSYDAQIQEHANANISLQEQLRLKEKTILELERRMNEKERELHAVKLDNEATWAKEDLIREQSKEIRNYRKDRENSEAERAQHIKQMNDLQEHIQERERRLMEIQEQHRISQETVLFKDEQIREAQAWITRAQEIDAFQTSTSHSLQAELRERTEQYNQLWLGCQRQFTEMERLHRHLQQLQTELADLRDKSEIYPRRSQITQSNSKDTSHIGLANGSQLEVNGGGSPSVNSGCLQNGDLESASLRSGGSGSAQTDHAHGIAFAPTSVSGMRTYLPTGQMSALHPFMAHQQGIPHLSPVTQSHFDSVSAMSSIQNWQNQQDLPDGCQPPNQSLHQTDHSFLTLDSHYEREVFGEGQVLHANYVNTKTSPELDSDSVIPSANQEGIGAGGGTYENVQSQQNLQQLSSQFHDGLQLVPPEQVHDSKEFNSVSDRRLENINRKIENCSFSVNSSSSDTHDANEILTKADSSSVSEQKNNNIIDKIPQSCLLEERALLASIGRTIGHGGRIRVSSTLPNRLGKMLAPLHWHDYKKKFGKLDDFVASHPELFFIEGDYIQLREGAQEIIAAKAAAAKVAASPSSYPSLSSVAVTPMAAESHRLKKVPSLDTSSNSVDHGLMNSERTDFLQRIVPSHGMPGLNLVGKQQRTTGPASSFRR